MLESGPAAGVIGTQALCHTLGIENAIAFDMGGTTAKAGVIYNGEALTTGAALIGGYDKALPVQIAMMDIFEVGTGGGSIARVEEGALRVGPQSAGAAPGPACYGLGGNEPTVTDANLVLGRLGADRFLGGEMQLDVDAAERALVKGVAKPLGMDATAAADGILRIAATAMSYAVKGVTTERGLDAGDFALVAYGGAGPLHAVAVAREIGIKRCIVPIAPGVFSAFGMLFSDLRYDFVRTWFTRLEDAPFERIEAVYRELENEGRDAIAATSVKPRKIAVKRAADMRYVGQEHAVTVDLPIKVFEQQDRTLDQAAFRCHARAAIRHVGAGRAGRDREPAHHRHRPDAQAAAGEDQARPARARQGGLHRQAVGLFRRQVPPDADLRPRCARRRQPDRRAGADRGTCLDHGADAGRQARGRCLWPSGDQRRGKSLKPMAKTTKRTGSKRHNADPVVTEIVRNGVIAVTEEMKTNLMRTAYNMIIYEALDFTTGLFTPQGETVSIGIGLPMFIRGMAETVKAKIKHFGAQGIRPGDIYVTNNSYLTGSHLNHVTLTLPIFHKGRLVASPAAWRTGSTSAAFSAA